MARVNKRDIPITKQQIALLHVAKKELGLIDEDYRSILNLYGAVDSAKHLTKDGFERVIDHLERLGFTSTTAQKTHRTTRYRVPHRDADGVPYPAQLRMIDQLFQQLGWTETERQRGFCQRMLKKPWPQTRAEANKIFEGLKAMLARIEKTQ